MHLGVDADIYMTKKDDILIACNVKQSNLYNSVEE